LFIGACARRVRHANGKKFFGSFFQKRTPYVFGFINNLPRSSTAPSSTTSLI
jgi:hypothetical protein